MHLFTCCTNKKYIFEYFCFFSPFLRCSYFYENIFTLWIYLCKCYSVCNYLLSVLFWLKFINSFNIWNIIFFFNFILGAVRIFVRDCLRIHKLKRHLWKLGMKSVDSTLTEIQSQKEQQHFHQWPMIINKAYFCILSAFWQITLVLFRRTYANFICIVQLFDSAKQNLYILLRIIYCYLYIYYDQGYNKFVTWRNNMVDYTELIDLLKTIEDINYCVDIYIIKIKLFFQILFWYIFCIMFLSIYQVLIIIAQEDPKSLTDHKKP